MINFGIGIVFLMNLILILLCFYSQPINLEVEYLKFKKDSIVLEYKRNRFIMDSLSRVNDFSHVSATANLAKRIILQNNSENYCLQFIDLDPLSLNKKDRDICLVCKNDILNEQVRKKYKILYENSHYRNLIYEYLNQK
jgi:hypothetical protein